MDSVLVRSAVLRIVFVAGLVLVALLGTAHAAPVAAPDAGVAGALFTPSQTREGIVWRSQWVLTPESAVAIDGGETRTLRLALPLDESARFEPTFGIVPVVEGGRVTALRVDRAALVERTVTTTVIQRLPSTGERWMRLGVPVAAGTAHQIVDGDLGAGTRFEVETGHSLERRVGYVAPPGLSHAAREEARRLTGYDSRVTGAPLYVRGEDVRAMGGIEATLMTPHSRARHTTLAIGVVFGGLVVALFAAVRKLRHAASVERADALLAAEVDALSAPRSGL